MERVEETFYVKELCLLRRERCKDETPEVSEVSDRLSAQQPVSR